MELIQERLAALREKMQQNDIQIYIVPTSDFHESEYVGEHFKAREFMTGFTGSAGTFVITEKEAGLWTDGRYFVQAESQLKDSTITLYKSGEEKVPTVNEFLKEKLQEGQNIGFDGRVVNAGWGRVLEKLVQEKNGKLLVEKDLVDEIWADRPKLAKNPAWILDLSYAGESVLDKLNRVRKVMEEKKADVHLLASLCDIAWLLNIRGNDILDVPVVLSFMALTKDECLWFVQKEALTKEVLSYLEKNEISVREYHEIYDYVSALENKQILLNPGMVNYRICSCVPKSSKLLEEADPSERMKAVKNETEIVNIMKAHVKDAVAMCQFMYWLKKNVGKIPMTELSAAEYLKELRSRQEGFIELSFETICGYNAHGAIVHYSATEESDVSIEPEGLLLVDSGGHYLEGTTDITRTFALGKVTEEMKRDFTIVARSNLNLAATKFMEGCSGRNLDVIARAPFWENGLDYKHGTGHGVGYVLNVHEGPNQFRWRSQAPAIKECAFEPGMITTDEPGIYIEGKYGIRLENELLCIKDEKNEYGQFLAFEPITFVPFDLDAIEADLLSKKEKMYLNAYHKRVREVVSPYLSEEENVWLTQATRAVE